MLHTFVMQDGKDTTRFLADQRFTIGITPDGHSQLALTVCENGSFSIAITDAYEDGEGLWLDVVKGDLGGSFPTVRFNDDLRTG